MQAQTKSLVNVKLKVNKRKREHTSEKDKR